MIIAQVKYWMSRPVLLLGLFIMAAGAVTAGRAEAQLGEPNVLVIPRGTSQLISFLTIAERISIGDPAVADAQAVSPQEVLVTARALGTTTLIVWLVGNDVRTYTIEVTVDAPALERQLQALFPGQDISVTSSGELVILSGIVTDPGMARRALDIARATGANIVDNLQVPPPRQILLSVRFAEVNRRALEQFGADFLAGKTSAILNGLAPNSGDIVVGSTLSEGLMELFLFEGDIQVSAVVDALSRTGTFRSLAEPNLLAIEGQEASFLAGGEFPYPVPQSSGGVTNAITIVFREFGIRLRFLPTVTIAGNIRLEVEPEVSSLDFANGVQFSGFNVPALLTRRASTQVELREGQTFAIAGLMDNTSQRTINKVPILGDIPLLGLLFRNREVSQNRTELIVLVTPRFVQPSEAPPPVPTGEPENWDWVRGLRNP